MSFSIAFIGASSGKRFVERKPNRRMGHSFPPSRAKDALHSIAVDTGRTIIGDPTSTVSGGATIALAQGAAAMVITNTLQSAVTSRVISGNGTMLVTTRKSRVFLPDKIDQRNFFLNRNMLGHELSALIDFLDLNGLAAIGPYGDLVDLFTKFSNQCSNGNFTCSVEFTA